MGNFLICPQRKGSKVSIQVCLAKCEIKHECDEFKTVSREALIEASKKLGLSVKHLKEIESIIQVEEKPEPEIEEKTDSTPPIQPLTEAEVAKEPLPVSEEGVENGEFDTDVVGDLVGNNKIPYPFNQNTLKPTLIPDGKAGELLSRALQIRTDIEVKFLEMGQVLDEIFENRFYINLGYPNQQEFCAGALDIKWRTATYLRNIYLWQTSLKIPGKKVAEIGWSKAAQILPVSKTKKDAMEWIEKAKEPGMTTQTLNVRVRIAQGKITEEEAKILPIKVLLSLSPDQKEIWDRAIEVGKKVTGSESVGHIVTGAILPDFLATYSDGEGFDSKTSIVSMALRSFEVAYRVKVLGTVIDQETGEILVEKK